MGIEVILGVFSELCENLTQFNWWIGNGVGWIGLGGNGGGNG